MAVQGVRFDHTAHRALWGWLAENPDKEKEDWVGWKENGGKYERVYQDCFACEYDNQVDGEYAICQCCPFNEDICNSGLFEFWESADIEPYPQIRSAIARMIRDYPIRTDIEIDTI